MSKLLIAGALVAFYIGFSVQPAAAQACPEGEAMSGRGPGTGANCGPLKIIPLGGNIDLYVSPASSTVPGVDTGDCTVISSPCQTIQYCVEQASQWYGAESGAGGVICNLQASVPINEVVTYPETTRMTSCPRSAGGGVLIIQGNSANPERVLIRPPLNAGHGFGIACPGANVIVDGMDISTQGTTAHSSIVFHGGVRGTFNNIRFGACAGSGGVAHVQVGENATQSVAGSTYTIYGDCPSHIYTTHETVSVNVGSTVTLAGEHVAAVTVTGGGTGYTSEPLVTPSGGGCTTPATFSTAIAGGVVTAISVVDPGEGCTSAPSLTITGGGASVDATATAVIGPEFSVAFYRCDRGGGISNVGNTYLQAGGGAGGAAAGVKFTADLTCWINQTTNIPGSIAGALGGETIIASSGTVNLGLAANSSVRVSGTNTILGFGELATAAAGLERSVVFDASLSILPSHPLALGPITIPGGRALNVAQGDRIVARFLGSNTWRIVSYNPASGIPPRHNVVINPSFDIWQRGTTFALGAGTNTPTADGWRAFRGVAGSTLTRAVGSGTGPAQYSVQLQRDIGTTDITSINLFQQIEDSDTLSLAGRSVVISFYYQMGADYSGAAGIGVVIYTGTGAGESFNPNTLTFTTGSVSSGQLNSVESAPAPGASGRSSTIAYTVPASATQLAFVLSRASGVAASGAADYVRISQVKLEIGPAATLYEPPTLANAWQEALRRYWKTFADATAPAQNVGANTEECRFPATIAGANASIGFCPFPIRMSRTVAGALPTCTGYNPAATNAQVRNITDGADTTATTFTVTQNGVTVNYTGTAGTAVGETMGIHVACDSGL